ncbi:hypothetical protein ACF0H5_010954 [Mactra antiquata]
MESYDGEYASMMRYKNTRSKNWTRGETTLLVDMCVANFEIVNGDCGDSSDKKSFWKEAAKAISALGLSVRTLNEVRKKWTDFKSLTKKKELARKIAERSGSTELPTLTDLEKQVLNVLPIHELDDETTARVWPGNVITSGTENSDSSTGSHESNDDVHVISSHGDEHSPEWTTGIKSVQNPADIDFGIVKVEKVESSDEEVTIGRAVKIIVDGMENSALKTSTTQEKHSPSQNSSRKTSKATKRKNNVQKHDVNTSNICNKNVTGPEEFSLVREGGITSLKRKYEEMDDEDDSCQCNCNDRKLLNIKKALLRESRRRNTILETINNQLKMMVKLKCDEMTLLKQKANTSTCPK